ncbi:hypothetical protein FsymDg_0586 [Candidatus Protofrankia datiscae]|uniref:Uncharacterized protein n=1 Tax=Candidatus Protofrankia datiscae TaxID=2716812 RepID=F8AUS2_9ACTN|nr:hypothetical protein FsymDg_0586 [Candidatus Protofrankia datiscae]
MRRFAGGESMIVSLLARRGRDAGRAAVIDGSCRRQDLPCTNPDLVWAG